MTTITRKGYKQKGCSNIKECLKKINFDQKNVYDASISS